MRSILKLGGIEKSEEEILEYTERKNKIYVDIISSMTPEDILPGVLDFISLLKKNDIRMAIGSSSKNAPTILKAVGLDSEFEAIVDGNQVTHSKPDPEVFLKGAAKLGLEPEVCLVLEDAISGVEAAQRAGMKCIGVGEEKHLNKADLVVPNLVGLSIDSLMICP
jgi:beta-phosphoglucomutase